jgi:hypothetical protein
MQQWRFGRGMFSLIAILVVATSLIMLGCPGDDGGEEEQTVEGTAEQAQELQGKSLTFNGSLIDPALAGQQVTVAFGNATGSTLPFTMTIGDTTLEGTATVSSITFVILRILVRGVLDPDGEVIINGVRFSVNAPLVFDLQITVDANGVTTIVITNPRTGASVTFEFERGETGSTGTTGSPSGPGGVQL